MFRGIKEKLLFLNKFLLAPGVTGSVFPSSRKLAKAVLDPVPWDKVELMAELGAGTGAITRHLPARARKEMSVLLFEKDPSLRHRLKWSFPRYKCYPDGSRLRLALHNEKLGKLDCVVCGLPLWRIRGQRRRQLMEQIAASMKDDGVFVAFEYFMSMQKDLKKYFEIQSVNFVPMNFPPAVVYVCRKKADVQTGQMDKWQPAFSERTLRSFWKDERR